jgi:hypothetical protein
MPIALVSVLSGLAALATFICFILVLIKMFQRGAVGVGVACILLFFCCGAGELLALVYGWVKASEWQITKLMTVYTVALAIMVVGFGVNPGPYRLIREQLADKGVSMPPQSKFDGRIDAALAIFDFRAKDAALAAVAKEAASEGDVEAVKRCVDRIQDFGTHDAAAQAAAMNLAKAGKPQAATDVAKSIRDFGRKDQTLSALARGDYGKADLEKSDKK